MAFINLQPPRLNVIKGIECERTAESKKIAMGLPVPSYSFVVDDG